MPEIFDVTLWSNLKKLIYTFVEIAHLLPLNFRIRLVRKTLPGVFMFEYHLPQFNNESATSSPLSLNLENDLPSVLQFPIGINDIGGSLVVELGVNIAKVNKKVDTR